MKKRLFTMLMSVALAAGYLQPVSVFAAEDVIIDDSEVEIVDPTAESDTPSDNKTEKKKKKKENKETVQQETEIQEEPVQEEPAQEQEYVAAEPEQTVEVIIPEETAISEEEFGELYGISWNAAGEVSDINRSALNSVILYEEGMTDVYLIKGQKLELPADDWTYVTSDAKKFLSIKKNMLKAKKVTAEGVSVMSGSDNSKKIKIHIYQPYMRGGVLTVGEGETAEIPFNYDKEHFDAAWYSSNPNVIRVSGNKVTGISRGTATVDVYVGGQKYSKKIKVDSVAKIKDFTSAIDLTVGQSVKVRFRDGFKMKGATLEIVSGNAAGDTGYAELTKDKLTGIRPGTAEIKAVDKKGNIRNLTVNVVAPEKELYLDPGKSKTVKFYKVKNSDAVWTTSDNKVATVDTKGRITAGSISGNTVITCTYKGVEYKTNVYVEKPEFATDEFLSAPDGQYTLDLQEGTYYTLVPVGVYRDIEYKSSNPSVAFVDEYGRLQGRKAGNSASITAIIGKTKLNIKVVVRKRIKIDIPEKYVNVLDYGAVPYDGLPDEAAFNAAIKAAAAAPDKDYTVYVLLEY